MARLLLAAVLLSGAAIAQPTPTVSSQETVKPLAFAVVSIKLNKSGGAQKFGSNAAGYRLTNLFFQMPIITAYIPQSGGTAHYAPDQVAGFPEWVLNDRYDIDAKVSDADLADWQDPAKQPAMLRAMLQNMLKDRLRLAVHREMKKVPVYSLVVGKNGPKLRETNPDVSHPGGIAHPGDGVTVPEMHNGESTGHCYGCSMHLLAWFLSGSEGRPVQDKTGLAGKYDFWLPAPVPVQAVDSGPSVFSVVEELGLKLVPATEEVETLVIDHIERPSEN